MDCEQERNDDRPRLRHLEVLPGEADGKQYLVLRDPLGFAAEPVVVTAEAGFILSLLDGARSRPDIQQEFSHRYGEILFGDLLDGILRQLDERWLLDNDRFARHRDEVMAAFRAALVREPAHAGADRAYPAEPGPLSEFLGGMFDAASLPRPAGGGAVGAVPTAPGTPLRALLAPHIDFHRGYPSYAHAYGALAGTAATRFVLLGVSHAPLAGPFALTRKDYLTPLGAVRTDRAFVDALAARLPFDAFAGEWNHKQEHSIEFQAVMLAWLLAGRDFTVVPILCGYPEEALASGRSPFETPGLAAFLEALAGTIAAAPGETVTIAGVDLAHVGAQFGDETPADAAVLAAVERADRETLAAVVAGDPEAFFADLARDENARKVCGVGAIYALLRLLAGKTRGELLDYRQWADGQSTVTFGAVAYR